jgi:hypothetical protein
MSGCVRWGVGVRRLRRSVALRRLGGSLALPLLLLAAGCLDSKTVVTVSPDGSGTIEQTFYTVPPEGGKERTLDEMRADYAQVARLIGAGVTLKSIEALEPRQGWKGYHIVYAFKDVTRLEITHLPPMSNESSDPGGLWELYRFEFGSNSLADAAGLAEELYHFEFRGGDSPQLTVVRPAVRVVDPPTVGEKNEKTADNDASLFAGCHVEFHVAVRGTITKTNATYPNEAKTGALLFHYNMGDLYKDAAALAAVRALCKLKDPKEAAAKLKDATIVKYLQVEPEERVTVEFK